MDDINNFFSENLKSTRNIRQIKATELAEKAYMPVGRIYDLERPKGEFKPSLEEVQRLCSVLEVDWSKMVTHRAVGEVKFKDPNDLDF